MTPEQKVKHKHTVDYYVRLTKDHDIREVVEMLVTVNEQVEAELKRERERR